MAARVNIVGDMATNNSDMDPEVAEEETDQKVKPVEEETAPAPPAPSKATFIDPLAGRMARDQRMMGSMFAELEEKMNESLKEIDEFNKKVDEERQRNWLRNLRKDIPGPLEGTGQTVEDILEQVHDLVFVENTNADDITCRKLLQVDETAYLALLGHSLSAYISSLDQSQLEKLSARIISDTTLWLSRLFRFGDASAICHDDSRQGLAKMCLLALHRKYEKFSLDGFNALYTKPPVIYVSAASKPGLGQYVCSQLGLPASSLCTIPCNTVFGSQYTIDVASFERQLQDDVSAARTPLLLIANAGTWHVGHTDNLTRLKEICTINDVWFHVQGHNLATLAMYSMPASVSPATDGDSMTVTPREWFGLPGAPNVTLYKTTEPGVDVSAGLCSTEVSQRLTVLPVWLCLQHLGMDGIHDKIKHNANMAQHFSQKLGVLSPSLKQTGMEPGPPDKQQFHGFANIIGGIIQRIIQLSTISSVVVFKYAEVSEKTSMTVAPYADNAECLNPATAPSRLYNAINRWLHHTLTVEVPKVIIDCVDLDEEGVCIRFSPMQTVQLRKTDEDDLNEFAEVLRSYIPVMNNVVSIRDTFMSLVEQRECLMYTDIEDLAGVGAVFYIPECWRDRMDSMSDEGKVELNKLNSDLATHLSHQPDIGKYYSKGHCLSDTVCVYVGMLPELIKVQFIVDQLATIGKELEDSSKFLEKMTELIKAGIDKAYHDLDAEAESKLYEEGVLRQIPVVASLYNWWSPPPKNLAKGRTFDLSSGQLESTEPIYEHHIQVRHTVDDDHSDDDDDDIVEQESPVRLLNGGYRK